MVDSVEVKFGASTDGLKAGVDEAKSQLGQVASAADSIQGNLTNLAAAFGTAFAVDKLEEFARQMSGIGQQIERMSAMTGLSPEKVENFQNAIQVLGGDSDNAGMSLMRLERNFADATDESSTAADAFHRLGVSQETIAKGDLAGALEQMAKKMADSSDGADKLGAMMQVAGRGGMQLITMLDQGPAGLAAIQEAIDANGPGFAALAHNFEQSAQQMNLMDDAQQKLGGHIYSVLEPAFDAVSKGLQDFFANLNKNVSAGDSFTIILRAMGAVIEGVTAAVIGLATGFEQLFDIAGGVLKALEDWLAGLAAAMTDLWQHKWQDAMNALESSGQKIGQDLAKGWEDAGKSGEQYINTLKRMMDAEQGIGVGTGVGGGSRGTGKVAPPSGSGGDSDDSEFEKYRQMQAEKYDVTKSYDDLAVQSGKMSRQQELADLQATLAFEKAMVDQSFEDQMAEYDKDSAEYRKLQDEKQIADEKFLVEHNRIMQEATKADETYWTHALNVVDKNMDTMLQGVLQGTQTMTQAFQRLASNMVLSFVEALAKMTVQYAAFSVGVPGITSPFGNGGQNNNGQNLMQQMIAGLLSLVGITTLQQGSEDANTAALISNTAALTAFAGASVGGGGGGFLGDALGIGAGLAAFAEGTSYVPNNMIAKIHKGERILTASENKALSSGQLALGGSAADTHVHLNVSAMDASSVASMFKKHGSAIANALISASRGGHNDLNRAFARM